LRFHILIFCLRLVGENHFPGGRIQRTLPALNAPLPIDRFNGGFPSPPK
jgi:hypothetical protein